MARYIELTIDQGATFVKRFIVKDADGAPMNLTSYAANAQMARSYYWHAPYSNSLAGRVVPLLATITDAAEGEITLSLSAADTAALRVEQQYVWECEIVPISGPSSRVRVAEGLAYVKPRVFKPNVS